MSAALVVYAIPLARMRSLLGSGKRDVVARIDYWADLAEVFENFNEDEHRLTPQEAVEHLLDGAPYRDGFEPLYVFSFVALCRVVGEGQDSFYGIRWGYVEAVDRYLESIGFPLRVADLATSGWPFDFPWSIDGPSVGHWTSDKVAESRKCLTKDRLDSADEEIGEALVTVSTWLDALAKRKGDVLIGIYEC